MKKRKTAQRVTGAVLSASAFSETAELPVLSYDVGTQAELPLCVMSSNNSLCRPSPVGGSYPSAVAWAAQNGITGGIGSGDFSPDANCTRAQIVPMLYRANQ